MYVCVCNGITEEQIREAARQGECSVEELRDRLGIKPVCDLCEPETRRIMDEVFAILRWQKAQEEDDGGDVPLAG